MRVALSLTGKHLAACLAAACLWLPAALHADVTVGELAVETGLTFGAGDYAGESGVLVTARDVVVIGHKGKTVYAYARIVKHGPPPFCERQLILSIDSASRQYPALQFRFPYSEILDVYGAGQQTLAVQFMFYTFEGSLPRVLDDFFVVKPVTLDLAEGAYPAAPDELLAKSRDYIAGKADADGAFAKVKEFSARTGLEFYVAGYGLSPAAAQEYGVTAPADEASVALGLQKLVAFLELLPPDFWKTTRLKAIAFTDGITYLGHPVGGGLDSFKRVVLLTTAAVRFDASGAMLLHTFCHEFFHYLEKIYYMHLDVRRWQALNPPGFSYRAGGALDYVVNPQANVMDEHFSRGFVTRYAASDHYQDTAETFAFLMVPALRRKALAWSTSDPYLKAKLAYLKTVVGKIHPGLDEKWFEGNH